MTCINGTFFDSADARIPVTDRGFRFGDGVFETIRVIEGVPYQWEFHLNRCLSGLSALRITPPNIDWEAMARQCLAKNKAINGFLRIAISRGSGSQGYMPDVNISPTWVIEHIAEPVMHPSAVTLYHSTIERPSLAALPVNHKLAQGITSTLALLEARDHGCDEALMLNASGQLCEAASANLFWIRDHKLYTPALSTGCVEGSTRAAILRFMPCHETLATITDLVGADAAFISNVRAGLLPVKSLLPHNISYQPAHPLFMALAQLLVDDRASYVHRNRNTWAAS